MPLFILENSYALKVKNQIKVKIKPFKYFKGTMERIKLTCKNIELFFELYKKVI